MTVLTWPESRTKFVSGNFYLRTIALKSSSTFTPRMNTSLAYQVWRGDFVYAPELGPSSWQDVEALMARLEGENGLLRIGDPLRCWPKYNRLHPQAPTNWSDGTTWSDGTGWVDGMIPPTCELDAAALRGANFIVLRGLPESITGALAAGDLLEIRPNGVPTETGNLYTVVVGGNTDANGEIGIEIRPRLRQNFAAGDQVVFYRPSTVMRMIDADQGIVQRSVNVGSFGFSLIEHLP